MDPTRQTGDLAKASSERSQVTVLSRCRELGCMLATGGTVARLTDNVLRDGGNWDQYMIRLRPTHSPDLPPVADIAF